jgi:uncharacterized membrane protein
MSASYAVNPWVVASDEGSATFGQAWSGQMGSDQVEGVRWSLRRNCSVTPAQMGGFFGSISVVSLVIAMAFVWHGAAVVLWFALLELTVLGVALLVFARHATDADVLVLSGRRLWVEVMRGSKTSRHEFQADWARVEPATADGSLIEISGRGQAVQVGRFVRVDQRASLCRELREALNSARHLATASVVRPDSFV